MMKEVDNDCNNIAKQVELIKHKPDLTNTDVKYDQTTTDLKTAISDMLYKIERVISAVSSQLSSLSTALYYFSESPLSHESYRRNSDNKDLSFLKTVVTYGSYKGSSFGDTFGAISSSDFKNVYGFSRPTSVDKFEKLGKIGEILRRVMAGSELVLTSV